METESEKKLSVVFRPNLLCSSDWESYLNLKCHDISSGRTVAVFKEDGH